MIQDIMPTLSRLLTYSDTKIVENTCRALSRIVDWAHNHEFFDSIVTLELVEALIHLTKSFCSSVSANMSVLPMLIRMLSTIGKARISLAISMVPGCVSIVSLLFSGKEKEIEKTDSFVLMESLSCLSQDVILSLLDWILMIFPPLSSQWSFDVELESTLDVNVHDSSNEYLLFF